MTMANLGAHCVSDGGFDVNSRDFKELVALLESAAAGKIEDGIIRVKITLPNQEHIYLDNEGGVRWGSVEKKLTGDQLARATALINRLTKTKVE